MTAKFQLIVNSDDPSELVKILAALGASTAIVPTVHVTAPGTSATTADEDEDDASAGIPADATGVDSTGLPWDDRIHSTPAAMTEKGVWRAKRGVGKNKAFVEQVEAELRARVSGQVQQQPTQQQPVYQAPAPQQPQFPQPGQFDPNAVQQAYQAPAPQQPQFPPPVQQQSTYPTSPMPQVQAQPQTTQQPGAQSYGVQPPQGVDFGGFMQKIQVLISQQMVDPQYLQSVAQRIGVASITDLQNSPQLLQNAVNLMASEGRWVN